MHRPPVIVKQQEHRTVWGDQWLFAPVLPLPWRAAGGDQRHATLNELGLEGGRYTVPHRGLCGLPWDNILGRQGGHSTAHGKIRDDIYVPPFKRSSLSWGSGSIPGA